MKKIFLLLLLSTTFVFSQVFNLQGVLRLPTGKAVVDGNYNFSFKIYDVIEGGAYLANWNEVQSNIEVKNGLYNILIGSRTPFALLAFDRTYYIGISVNGSGELSPRVQLTGAPYALALNGTNNRVPNSGAMQFDTEVWHKSADTPNAKNRIRFVNNGETKINSRVSDVHGIINPAGMVVAFAGTTAPDGWLLCNGEEISKQNYPELSLVIGTTYGAAQISTNFKLPNLNGRMIVGAGTSTNTAYNQASDSYTNSTSIALAANGGYSNIRIQATQMPPHNHAFSPDWVGGSDGAGPGMDHGGGARIGSQQGINSSYKENGINDQSSAYSVTSITGGINRTNSGAAASPNPYLYQPPATVPIITMPPYLGVNYIIKY